MSFFGQQNNQQSGSGFGGFGSNNSTNTGFGQQPAQNSGSSLFGNNNNNNTQQQSGGFGGFGSTGTSGFGSALTNSTPFGQNRPAFGSSTTSAGGLFGSGTATSGTSGGFGGFGGNSNNSGNNNNASSGGLFGSASKPAFGANTGGGLFGGGGNTAGGFGSSNTQNTSAFGTSSALGQNVGECQGTGSAPFQPFTEKEGGTGNQTNHFQSISFMAPYKNFSFEELRLADYNQGRRFGNGSGQAGAFGASNFGGFGQQNNSTGFGSTNTSGGLFGQPAATSSPFGASQPAQSGFGSNAGGTLFGAQKPAGGLFGQASTSSQPTGGLFGSAGNSNTGSGFGSTTNSGGFGNSGGLFAGNNNNNNNQNQQSKPFSFGTSTATSGASGFGSGFGTTNTSTTTGGLFGQQNQTNNNPFGQQQPQQQQQQPNQAGGLFGSGFGSQNQPQNQNQNSTGTGFGFGQQGQEQKPGGLFGNTAPNNTAGGLFGNTNQNQQQTAGSGLFGNQNNQQPAGNSLFGNKPAATGTGLFGNNNNTNTSGGLFGGGFGNNNQTNQNQGGGLFGGGDNSQKPGGLFGNQNTNTGGLFGNSTNNQNSGGGLFGSTNQQPQQQPNSLFGQSNNNQGSSLFGNSQQQQPQQQNAFQAPQAFQTSLLDPNAFGSPSIFSGLPPPPQVTGPIATPISSKKPQKKNTLVPHHKFTPGGSSRFQTPQRRGGFGFSYSTYGTPGSASSNASTPGGFSSSSLYNSIGRGLGKSLSTSNLRRNFEDAESVLTPGAFSAGSSRYGGSSNLKRLTIDRSLRTDLFSGGKETPQSLPSPEKEKQPSILKKKVSFDASAVGGNGELSNAQQVNGAAGNETDGLTAEEQGFIRSPRTPARARQNGLPSQPEAEQVRGNELAIVHEDASPENSSALPNGTTAAPRSQEDQKPGKYWMKPSKEELVKLSKDQKAHFSGFVVGRDGCGKVEFDMPVDLTMTKNLDEVFENVVLIELRSITVYPDQAKKPAQGKGLNVPSTIYLENSWPRGKDRRTPLHEKSGPRFNKHVERLRKVGGTDFVRYEKDTGVWVFKVPHFTTYSFDYDDEASVASEGEGLNSSVLSSVPDTPTPKSRVPRSDQTNVSKEVTPQASMTDQPQHSFDTSVQASDDDSSPDDTFQFRSKNYLPGAFDLAALPDADQDVDHEMEEIGTLQDSFLGRRSAASPSDSGEDEPGDEQDAVNDINEQSVIIRDADQDMEIEMAGIFPGVGPETNADLLEGFGTPKERPFSVNGDWADALQQTVSPKKQDRAVLREKQSLLLGDHYTIDDDSQVTRPTTETIQTHGDLMKSLFGTEETRKSKNKGKQGSAGASLKWPYPRGLKSDEDTEHMPEHIRLLHDNYKPHWALKSVLMYSAPRRAGKSRNRRSKKDDGSAQVKVVISDGRDILSSKFDVNTNLVPGSLTLQRKHTKVSTHKGIPMAHPKSTPFRDIANAVQPNVAYESDIWALASILFDDLDPSSLNVSGSDFPQYESRLRKDSLVSFWSKITAPEAARSLEKAANNEERAIAHLSHNNIVAACGDLIQGKDFRLSTLIAQLGDGDEVIRDDMEAQIQKWRELNALSEISEPVRALYALLAGQTCVCEGKKGPVEDRARDFVISERFNLDWKRAFGLRLYYATLASEPIEVAIKKYAVDLEKGDEGAKPVRSVVDADGKQLITDGEDLLWSLLKLYAASKEWLPLPSIVHILNQQDVTPDNKRNVLLSFQLYHALTVRFPAISNPAAADSLAVDFSQQLDSVDEWVWACFATLHISSPAAREQGLQDLLAHHAHDFKADEKDSTFKVLTKEFKIPESWIWQAKALAARAITRNRLFEVECLVLAGDWGEAHAVLRRSVGPRIVIAEDWTLLGKMLERFQNGKENIEDWAQGGQVYEDFLYLVAPTAVVTTPTLPGNGGNNTSNNSNVTGRKAKQEAVIRLLDVLPDLAINSTTRASFLMKLDSINDSNTITGKSNSSDRRNQETSRESLEEAAALRIMSGVTVQEALALSSADSHDGADGVEEISVLQDETRLLTLPLTAEAKMKVSRALEEKRFRDAMVRGGGSTH